MLVSKEKAIQLIDRQIALVKNLNKVTPLFPSYGIEYQHAVYGAVELIARLFGNDEARRFQARIGDGGINRSMTYAILVYSKHLESCIAQLLIYRDRVDIDWAEAPELVVNPQIDTVETLEWLARSLPQIVHQLCQRHDNRETLRINDEYDLQDLFRALLHLCFNDIRPEEGTSSFGGTNGRMDFLLYQEKTVVELKMAKANLRNKRLKEQLLVDIPHYRKHPDCKAFVGIVYDPNRYISNPEGFETDLSEPSNGMPVRVFVVRG